MHVTAFAIHTENCNARDSHCLFFFFDVMQNPLFLPFFNTTHLKEQSLGIVVHSGTFHKEKNK